MFNFLKYEKIKKAIKQKICVNAESSETDNDNSELLEHLKETFKTLKSRREKVMLLGILPPTWIIQKIKNLFDALLDFLI